MALVMIRVVRNPHRHLLNVHDLVAPGGFGAMEVEWIDGYDLGGA